MERFARRPVLVTLRMFVVLGLAGCSNSQQSSANPFMQPDRVPPPATRTIAPGTAQPYYPGDPVPAAQASAPGAAAMAQMPGAPTASARPSVAQAPVVPNPAGTTPSAAMATASSPTQAFPTTPPAPLAFSNERSVSVPRDDADLRFTAPSTAETQPVAAQTAATAATANQFASAPQSAVVPASFTQPATQPMPASGPMPTASNNTDGNAWRPPQIPGASTASNFGVMHAQYVQPQSMQPTMLAAQPMQTIAPTQQIPVELRSVPSPTEIQMSAPTIMQPSQGTQMQMAPMQTSPPPRMRFPSWTDPTTWFTPRPETMPAANQQLVGYMVPGPNGTQQMISVEQYQAMLGGATQPTLSTASADGFQPRGTATK